MTNETTSVTVKQGSKMKMRTKEITFISLMGALAAVLMLFKFPIPMMPPFMDFDFAGVVEIIGGLMFGPVAAVYIIIVKILLKMVMMGSSSIGTGEVQNILLSCSYVLPAVLLYMTKKTKKRAALGLILGTIAAIVTAIITNLYLIIPFYAKLAGMTTQDIIDMCTAVNPAVTDVKTFVILGIIPFNIIKYGASSVLTLLLYKHLSKPIKKFIQE